MAGKAGDCAVAARMVTELEIGFEALIGDLNLFIAAAPEL